MLTTMQQEKLNNKWTKYNENSLFFICLVYTRIRWLHVDGLQMTRLKKL